MRRLLLLGGAIGDLLLRQDYDIPRGLRFYSFGVFLTNPPTNLRRHQLLIPEIDPATCEFDLAGLADYTGDGSPLALVVVPRQRCLSYAFPVRDVPAIRETLRRRGYPGLDIVAWATLPGELQPPGNPNSDMMLPDFPRDANVSYHVIDDTFAPFLATHGPAMDGYFTEGICPWYDLLASTAVNAMGVAFDVAKCSLMAAQVFVLLLSLFKRSFGGYVQVVLLGTGFLQLGGDLIISRYHLFGMAPNVYVLGLLLATCLVNSAVNLAWYRILRLLNLAAVRLSLFATVTVESLLLLTTLVIQMALVILLNRRAAIHSPPFAALKVVTLVLVTLFPLLTTTWVFTKIRRFSLPPGPMRRLTATIFVTRIAFVTLLVSSNLQLHQATTPLRYLVFGTVRDAALLLYNLMAVLTVVNIQAIRPKKPVGISSKTYTFSYHEESTHALTRASDFSREASAKPIPPLDSSDTESTASENDPRPN